MKKWFWLLVLAGALTLPGCLTSQKELADKGAAVMDNALEIALWEMCYAASIGSLRREFNDDYDRIRSWQNLCGEVGMPISPIPLPMTE